MLTQTTAITSLNLKSIPDRWGPSLVIVIGLAGVVAVFTALLAMVEKGTGGQFQLTLDYRVWLIGIAAIVVLSVAVGLLPALRAQRLKIVDALAGR